MYGILITIDIIFYKSFWQNNGVKKPSYSYSCMTFGCKEILVQAQNLSTQTRQPGFHRFRYYLMAGTKRRRSQVSSAG